jgi:hypothetical protein
MQKDGRVLYLTASSLDETQCNRAICVMNARDSVNSIRATCLPNIKTAQLRNQKSHISKISVGM